MINSTTSGEREDEEGKIMQFSFVSELTWYTSVTAAHKSTPTDKSDLGRDNDADKTAAVSEGVVINLMHTIRDGDIRQVAAIPESSLSDNCYTVGDNRCFTLPHILNQSPVFNSKVLRGHALFSLCSELI